MSVHTQTYIAKNMLSIVICLGVPKTSAAHPVTMVWSSAQHILQNLQTACVDLLNDLCEVHNQYHWWQTHPLKGSGMFEQASVKGMTGTASCGSAFEVSQFSYSLY